MTGDGAGTYASFVPQDTSHEALDTLHSVYPGVTTLELPGGKWTACSEWRSLRRNTYHTVGRNHTDPGDPGALVDLDEQPVLMQLCRLL